MTASVIANLTWLVVSFHAAKTGGIGRGKRYLAKEQDVCCSAVIMDECYLESIVIDACRRKHRRNKVSAHFDPCF